MHVIPPGKKVKREKAKRRMVSVGEARHEWAEFLRRRRGGVEWSEHGAADAANAIRAARVADARRGIFICTPWLLRWWVGDEASGGKGCFIACARRGPLRRGGERRSLTLAVLMGGAGIPRAGDDAARGTFAGGTGAGSLGAEEGGEEGLGLGVAAAVALGGGEDEEGAGEGEGVADVVEGEVFLGGDLGEGEAAAEVEAGEDGQRRGEAAGELDGQQEAGVEGAAAEGEEFAAEGGDGLAALEGEGAEGEVELEMVADEAELFRWEEGGAAEEGFEGGAVALAADEGAVEVAVEGGWGDGRRGAVDHGIEDVSEVGDGEHFLSLLGLGVDLQ